MSPSDELLPVLRARRSLLFFPATRPDLLEKAVRTGTDAVCVDLEDAIASDRKEDGRAAAIDLLRRPAPVPAEVVLRINSPRTEDGLRDVLAVLEARVAPDALMIPKVESAEEVRWVEALLEPGLPAVRLIPMVESCRGLEQATGIASASPRVSAVMLGGVDLSAELGCALEWDALLYARSRIVHAAKLAGVDVFDMPFLDVADADGLAVEARAAARLGFTGKAAIHPSQLPPILAAFSPGAAEVERARKVVAAYERNRGGVLLVDGRLVERPVVHAAQRTLALAAAMKRKPGALQENAEEHRSGPPTDPE